jgi:signal transduction histidine kinase
MLPLLSAGGLYLFYAFDNELRHETDEELLNDQVQWKRYIEKLPAGSEAFGLSTPEYSLHPTTRDTFQAPLLNDVWLDIDSEQVPYRQLTQVIRVRDHNYMLTINKSLLERKDLILNIIRVMLIVFAGLLLFVLLFNWWISKRIWKPFHHSLDKIKTVELKRIEAVSFDKTSVFEFNQLNAALNNMTKKIWKDYTGRKEFIEDAAHEMQTPLAIAQSKLELLLQESDLSKEQLDYVSQAGEAIRRLSKLNHSLLLLSKIDNEQYPKNETISLAAVTDKYLCQFEEFIKDKHIGVNKNTGEDCQLLLHPLLADSLISNLLGNAIRYNFNEGSIDIHIHRNGLVIENTSELPAIDPHIIFNRFKPAYNDPDNSNGLGLAIIKKICDTHGLHIAYAHKGNKHTFSIKKSEQGS